MRFIHIQSMNTKKIRNNFSDYFWLNRWMLEFCGVLPVPEKGFFISCIFIILTLVSCSFLVIPGYYTIARGKVDIETSEKVNMVGESLEILVGAMKMIALLPYRSSVLSLSRRAARLWDQIRTDADLRIVEPYSRRGLYLTYGFTGNVFFALISLVVAPIFMRYEYSANGTILASKSLPYSAGIVHEDRRLFDVWWALQAPAGFFGMIPIVGIDTSIGFFVLQACAHFRLLQTRFRDVAKAEASARAEKGKIIGAEYRKMLIECINTHQEIIRFCDEIEYSFRIVVLIQMILSITAICGFGFNLLIQEKDRVTYGLHLFGAALQLLIFCWPPDNLQKESMDIGFEAINLRWYNWINTDKKLIEFIILRSQKPILMTAGKFSIMSLETFSAVLSSAFSFFSILRKTL